MIVRLTPAGFDTVERVVEAHLECERELLAALSPRQCDEVQRLLRAMLISLGDTPLG